MDKSRLETKVGLFVFVGLALLAVLLIQFSKGTSIFRGTYELRLQAANVGGLKPRASVLLSGVQVGAVSDIQLAPAKSTATPGSSSSNPAFSATSLWRLCRRPTRGRC